MSLITYENFVAASTVLAGVGGGYIALVKFRAWWKDRLLQMRMESATYFKEKCTEAWQIELGTQQLLTAHFLRLTGIDRPTGHEAIRRCHIRLGGTPVAWRKLRDVGSYLRTTGHVARVRKMHGRDHCFFAFLALLFSVLSIASVTMVGLTIGTVAKILSSPGGTNRLTDPAVFMSLLYVILATSVMAFFALVALKLAGEYGGAITLRKELHKIGLCRRKQAANLSPAAPPSDQWSLTEIHQQPVPLPKPFLVANRADEVHADAG